MSHLYVNTSLLPMSTPLLRRFQLCTGVYAASTVSTLPMTRDLATSGKFFSCGDLLFEFGGVSRRLLLLPG